MWEQILEFCQGDSTVAAILIAIAAVVVLIVLVSLASLIVSIYLAIKYYKYNHTQNSAGITGFEAARKVLDENGLEKIKVKVSGSLLFGNSYSHYFKKVRLRRFTKNKTSISSLAMGVQKSCLAILDKEGDKDMKTRIRLIPLIDFGPFMFIPIVIVGALIDFFCNLNGVGAIIGVALALLFFILSIVMNVKTLKTEKKAQARACEIMRADGLVTEGEIEDMKDLFRLYNIEYINNVILSILELIYAILRIILRVVLSKAINK